MGFRGDDRGVTVQVGAVLLFGILIISMSMYQTTVVPTENEQVEYQHNQRVQEDMQSFRSAVTRADGSESTQSVAVRLGTQFTERALFVNPPAASGTLRTEDTAGIEIRNARALDDETDDYWSGVADPGDGDAGRFATNRVLYSPNYHVYQNAPTTVYENGVLYNEFDDANRVVQSGQSIVDGRRISLVAVDGELSQSQTGALAVDVRPVSVSDRTVTVDGDSDPISVVVPSKLDPSVWQNTLLAEEYDGSDSDPDKYVAEVNPGPTSNTVEIVFESGTEYDLNLAKVGVGTDGSDSTATYLTDVSGGDETIPENGERRLVAEVRDEFNNPVSGVEVTASVDGPGTVTATAVSRSDGRAVFTYAAPTNVDGEQSTTVTTKFGSSPGERERVEFDLTVADSDNSGGSGDSTHINPGEAGSVTQKSAVIDGSNQVLVTLENTDSETDRTISQVRFNFYSQDSQGGAGTNSPTSAVFNGGETTLDLRGPFQDVSVPVNAGDETTLTFKFQTEESGNKRLVDEGDFFVFTVLYADGDAATYFVAPDADGSSTNSTPGNSGNNNDKRKGSQK